MNKPRTDPTLLKTVSSNIKKFRKRLISSKGTPLTQQFCAAEMGVNQQDWNRWESGKILPSPANQRKIAGVLKVSLTELRGENAPAVTAGAKGEGFEMYEEYVSTLTRLLGYASMTKESRHRERMDTVIAALDAISSQLQEAAGEEDTFQGVG